MVSPPTAECTNSSSKYNNKKRKLRLWLVFQRKGGVTNDKVNVNLPALIDTMHMSTSDLTVGALWYKYGSIPNQSQMCHLTFGLRQALALLAGNKKYCFRHIQRRQFLLFMILPILYDVFCRWFARGLFVCQWLFQRIQSPWLFVAWMVFWMWLQRSQSTGLKSLSILICWYSEPSAKSLAVSSLP